MSTLFPRNTVGFTTMDDLLLNNLQIQTQAVGGFSIYVSDPTNPLFTVDGSTGTITTRGTLTVLGTASFTTIEIASTTQSLFELASNNNISDLVDLGLFGQYNSGAGALFGGVYRNSADPARRWFFVKDFTCTPPISVVPGITTANFVGAVADTINTNAGTVSTVAYGFYSDPDTGMYSVASNSLGFSTGSSNILTLTNTGSALNVSLATTAILYYSQQATQNDRASSAGGGITTGSITLQSSGLADKFQHYISTNPVAAYSGETYSFGTSSHYFITNNNASLFISYTTETLSPITQAPDYRHSSKVNLIDLNNAFMSVSVPVYSTLSSGTPGTPAYTFSDDPTTGMYQQTVNSVSFAAQGTQVLDLHSTYIYPAQQIQAPNGSVSAPIYSFNAGTSTGLFRDTGPTVENISIALGGVNSGVFILNTGSHPQLQMPLGTTTYPTFAFGTTGSGIYSPQIGGATSGLISVASANEDVFVFKNRTGTASIGYGNHQCLNAIDILPTNIAVSARLDLTSSKFLTAKAQTGSFQGYNLIDSAVLALYRFNNFSSLGLDSSESATTLNALVVGPPATQYSVSDGTIVKKYVLDLTNNNSPTAMYLSLTSYVSNFASVNTFTVSFWFKCTAAPAANGTLINFLNTSNSKNISISVLNASDSIQVNVDSDSITTLQFHTTGVSIKNGLWHHVVLELGTGGNKFYLDGTQLLYNVNLTYTSGGNGVPTADYATNTLNNLTFNRITIGGQYDGATFSGQFTGYLYTVYMTAATLTASQIAALYAEGSLSVYSLDVTTLNVANQISSGQTTVEDGTASAPAYAFTNEPSTGWYRIGTGNIGLSLLGVNDLDINSTRLKNAGVYYSASGAVGAPAYTFTADTTSGLYLVSSGSLSLAASGADKLLVNSIVQIGSGATDTTTKLYLPNGTAAAPVLAFISDTKTGIYRIGTNNLGITLNGSLSLDLNTTRMYSVNPIYLADGTVSAPTLAFNSNSGTGAYYVSTNNAINIANNGVLNATFENPSTPRLVLAQGSLSVPSLTFAGATTYGAFYDLATTSLKLVAGGVNTIKLGSALTNINTATTISNTATATLLYTSTNGSNSAPTYSFTNDTTSGMYLQSVGILSVASNALEGARLAISGSANSYLAVGNITGASTTTFDNMICFAGLTGKQSASFDYSVMAERFWSGTTSSELLLFKNINSADRIRLRAYTHVFQTPTASETYSTLADNNTACTMAGGIVYVGDTTSGSSAIIKLPTGSASAPPISFVASANTGLYYAATSILNVATGGTNSWSFATAGHISYAPLTIDANGTTQAVAITSTKICATATQTLLNSAAVVEYNFTNTTALATDNSINNYTGGTNGTVAAFTPTADANSNGPLNAYAIQIGSGASNGVYTNVTSMTQMTNTIYLNTTIMIQFNDLSAGALPGNCWTIYGNYTVPAQNYIRLYMTTGGVLNIQCVSNSSVLIAATYSSLTTALWYRIEFVTSSSGNSIYLNGAALTLTYSTGSSATTFPFNTSMVSTAGIRAYVGGDATHNSVSSNIAYFSVIQLSSSDTVATTYREQVHELTCNKLTVSGYPYDNNSTTLNEGQISVSSKTGQLQWSNALVVSSTAITTNSSLDLVVPSLKLSGMVKYNYTTNANSSINLTADRTSHYVSLTNNNPSITLPTGSSQNGREFCFIWRGTPGTLTITSSGGDTIGNSASPFTYSAQTYATFRLIYDSTATDWVFM